MNIYFFRLDIDKSIVGTRQSYSTSIDLPGIIPYKNNEQLSSDNDLIHAIHCLRVDGPLDFNRDDRIGSVNALNNLGLLIDQNIPGLLLDFSISHKNQHNRVRAQSPKVTDSSKESRRKRGGMLINCFFINLFVYCHLSLIHKSYCSYASTYTV